jgi:hypothetical protein
MLVRNILGFTHLESGMLRAALCLGVAALLGAAAAYAQAAAPYGQSGVVDRIEILDVGLFSVQRTKDIIDPGVTAGKRYEGVMRFLQPTTQVAALIGASFGIRYRVVGARPGSSVAIRVVWRFPSQGLLNPARGETVYQEEHTLTRVIGESAANTYTFDSPWEAVPGIWAIELWHGDRKLAEQSFTVSPP